MYCARTISQQLRVKILWLCINREFPGFCRHEELVPGGVDGNGHAAVGQGVRGRGDIKQQWRGNMLLNPRNLARPLCYSINKSTVKMRQS